MRLAPLALLLLPFAACGSEPEQPAANVAADGQQAEADDGPTPKQRLKMCQDDLLRYTQGGMVALDVAGKPTATRSRWDGLSPVGKTEIAEITACIQSGGEPGAQEVVITETGTGAELARINTPNRMHMP